MSRSTPTVLGLAALVALSGSSLVGCGDDDATPSSESTRPPASSTNGTSATSATSAAVGLDGRTPAADTITFETLAGSAPMDEQSISDEFVDGGVTFRLENDGLPTIAKVGSPTTAFATNDSPDEGQGIGEYFLTDDGSLNNDGTPPALVVEFTTPTTAASGQILDIDFDEQFTIEARNPGGEVVESMVIVADDEGTGDAIATLWSFDRDGADIASISFTGLRQDGRRFGLGLDNLNPSSVSPFVD